MSIKKYQVKCYKDYKLDTGLPPDYNFFYGNPVNVLVPIETALNGVMIVGAYPSAKFATINGIADVPLYDNDSPFSSESYFDGSRVRVIPSGHELDVHYLQPLKITRDQCWITDLVKVFLFKDGHVNRYRKLDPQRFSSLEENRSKFEEYALKSMSWLKEEILIACPKVIITLGVEVTSVLFNVSQSNAKVFLDGKIRELTLAGKEQKVICLPHPGIIMKLSPTNPWPKKFVEEIIPNAYSELRRVGL